MRKRCALEAKAIWTSTVAELTLAGDIDMPGVVTISHPAAVLPRTHLADFIHTRFYCYAYTFGALFVLALYNRYLEEGAAFVPRYRELLAAGDSVMPDRLLKRLDMDFSQEEFWQGGFKVIQKMLGDLTDLVEN